MTTLPTTKAPAPSATLARPVPDARAAPAHVPLGRTATFVVQCADVVISRGRRRVLDGISVDVRPGELVGCVGPNGAGKTSLIYAVLGFLRPDSGRVAVLGHDPASEWPRIGARVSVVADEPGVPDVLTPLEYLEYFAALAGVPPDAVPQTIRRVLADVGLGSHARARAATLSKGQRQRVALARTFLASPVLIVMDEPFDGLDVDAKRAISERLLTYVAAGGSVLITSHDLHELERTCDRIVLLRDGHLVGVEPGRRDRLGPHTALGACPSNHS